MRCFSRHFQCSEADPQGIGKVQGADDLSGSIFAVVMGPTTLDTPQPAMGIHDFSILFFLIGGAVILGLQKMKDIKQ